MKELIESLEKYLQAIFELTEIKDKVKVKDVSNYLKIGGASTSAAIKTLSERKLINYIAYKPIFLTEKGKDLIEIKNYRHKTISKFLKNVLEIEDSTVEKNATALEYSMTEDVLMKFVHFLDFMEQCNCEEPRWIKSCKHNLETGHTPETCISCKKGIQGCGSCCGGCQKHID